MRQVALLRRTSLPAFSTTLLLACGAVAPAPTETAAPPEAAAPPSPPAEVHDSALLFTQADDVLGLAEIDLETGMVVPTAPRIGALPHAAKSVRGAEAFGHALLRFDLADGTTTLETEGTTWRELAKAPPGAVLDTRVSEDAVVTWTALREAGQTRAVKAFVLHQEHVGDGSERWTDASTLVDWDAESHAGEAPPDFAAFAPLGALFTREGALEIARVSRPEKRFNDVPPSTVRLGAVAANESVVEAVFADSVIVRGAYPALRWVDSRTGATIEAPGFVPSRANVRGTVQLEGATVSFLRDGGRVIPAGALGVPTAAGDVLRVADNLSPLALVRTDAGLEVRDQGASPVAGYAPEPWLGGCATTLPHASESVQVLGVRGLDGGELTVLARVEHTCAGGDQLARAGTSLDVWRVRPKTRAARALRLATWNVDEAVPRFRLTSRGAHAYAVVAGGLETFDVTTGLRREVTPPGFKLRDWPVHLRGE